MNDTDTLRKLLATTAKHLGLAHASTAGHEQGARLRPAVDTPHPDREESPASLEGNPR